MSAADAGTAIRKLALDRALLERFKVDPEGIGGELGLDAATARLIRDGDRGALRALGLDSGTTILVGRWFGGSAQDTTVSDRFEVVGGPSAEPVDVPPGLAFAGACSHVPDFLARPEIDPPEQIARLGDGYRALAEQLAAAELDVLVVTADNHFQTFSTAGFVVGIGATHSGSMAFFNRPDLDLALTGDPELASALAADARSAGLEVETAPRVDLDHGLIVPLRQLLDRPDLPVVPVLTQPARSYSPFSARALGRAFRGAVTASGRRVGILATGGLSHWLDPGKFGAVDEEFDLYLLQMIQRGRGGEIGDLEPYPLLDHGQYEFLNWLILFGLMGPSVAGDVLAYEPMTASGGGWTVVHFPLPVRVP